METTVTNFWNCFVKVQLDMLFAYNNKEENLVYQLFKQLEDHPAIRENGLILIIFFPTNNDTKAKLCILTRGLKKKKRLANQLVLQAPLLDNWIYQVGLPPYEKKAPHSFVIFLLSMKKSMSIRYMCIFIKYTKPLTSFTYMCI